MAEPIEYGLTESDVRLFRWMAQQLKSGQFQVNAGAPYRPRVTPILGKTDASHAKGATGTISIYSGTTKGSETDTGENLTGVYNRFADLASGKWVLCFPVDAGWELWAGEC